MREEADKAQLEVDRQREKPKTDEEMERELKELINFRFDAQDSDDEDPKKKRQQQQGRSKSTTKAGRFLRTREVVVFPRIRVREVSRIVASRKTASELKQRDRRVEDACANIERVMLAPPSEYYSNGNGVEARSKRKGSQTLLNKSLIKYYIEKSFTREKRWGKTMEEIKQPSPRPWEGHNHHASSFFGDPATMMDKKTYAGTRSFLELTKDEKVETLNRELDTIMMTEIDMASPSLCIPQRKLPMKPDHKEDRRLSPAHQVVDAQKLRVLDIEPSVSLKKRRKGRALIYHLIKNRKVPLYL